MVIGRNDGTSVAESSGGQLAAENLWRRVDGALERADRCVCGVGRLRDAWWSGGMLRQTNGKVPGHCTPLIRN